MLNFVQRALDFIRRAFLESDDSVSFARLITAFLVVFFCAMDAWYFHRKGELVDNGAIITQMSAALSFYGANKFHDGIVTIKTSAEKQLEQK